MKEAEGYRYKIKDVPSPVWGVGVALALGEGLTPRGKLHLYKIVRKFFAGERVWASEEIGPILEDSKYNIITEGEKIFPYAVQQLLL